MIPFKENCIKTIKEKKELSSLDDEFIERILENKILLKLKLSEKKLTKNTEGKTYAQYRRNKECKTIISETRKYLRNIYGVFIKKQLEDEVFKEELDEEKINELLEAHQSTSERKQYYQEFYKQIFEVLTEDGLAENYKLLDLACGFNPFSYEKIPVKPREYTAIDLSKSDMEKINLFFKKTKINGKAMPFDLLSSEFNNWLDKNNNYDVVFLLKALDSLEVVERHSSKKLLSKLKAKYVVVTFPKLTIGGKQSIADNKRNWFETFCKANSWELKEINLQNERIFIIIK
jgi:predicted RNA methylase